MADAVPTDVGQVKDFFPDIAFLFNLAWQEHNPLASLLDGEKS
jgi:hypothetical protein